MHKKEGGLIIRGEGKKRDRSKILVSIITVVYNSEDTLKECIESIICQDYSIEDIEYIIIDGGSDDRTLGIILEYDRKGYIDYWISEKDSGIYHAMNKGIRLSSGQIISFLNSDDYFYSDAVQLSVDAILKNDAQYSFGNALCVDPKNGFSFIWKGDLSYIFFDSAFVHQTEFVKRQCFEEIGFFEDRELQVWSDWEFNTRLYKNGYRHVYVDSILVCYRLGGISGVSNRGFEKDIIRERFFQKDIGLSNKDVGYLMDIVNFSVVGEVDKKLDIILTKLVKNDVSDMSRGFLKSLCLLARKNCVVLEEEIRRLENDQWYLFGRLNTFAKISFLFGKVKDIALKRISFFKTKTVVNSSL